MTVPYLTLSTDSVSNIKLEIGTLYEPNLLPDYRGDLFQHKNAKLVQQDIKDINDDLVAPWHMQDKLRPGTIVVMDTTLVCWHITGKGSSSRGRKVCTYSLWNIFFKLTNITFSKVYQIQAHRIQILHESDEPTEELKIFNLPRKAQQKLLSFDTSPRKGPTSSFSAFGSPPFKKARRMWFVCKLLTFQVQILCKHRFYLSNTIHAGNCQAMTLFYYSPSRHPIPITHRIPFFGYSSILL